MGRKGRRLTGFLQAAENDSMYVGVHVCVCVGVCVHTFITHKYMQRNTFFFIFKDVHFVLLNVISKEYVNLTRYHLPNSCLCVCACPSVSKSS